MNLARIEGASNDMGLALVGAFHPDDPDIGTLVLFAPAPDFWQVLKNAPEYHAADPVDHWSARVFETLATKFNARAILPFVGPPYAPFLDYAKQSGRAWNSHVGMLVHDQFGLMISYRGALAFDERIDLPPTTHQSPCETCIPKPCATACPVNALTPAGYDVPKCKEYLRSNPKSDCMTKGCAVRRACPISAGAKRDAAQSAHYMRVFRGNE
ncbi:hypothetical protein GCM10008927_13750 [Amylibacter ulvae]|uniref:4Fe-4S ferredoxin-type domain-containing protein n=1 Tax=Paramylibacter ulvae TaxID=1651968 RepID=A0ABQ3D4H5_9RHOB|nr:ferredoxin [Amylibacter ulvae]GHA50064.1 hypothetical protein GCM10008927_13750 [Amylibacter ulvae]